MKSREMVRVTLSLLAAVLLASKAQAIAITDVTFVIPPPYYATDAQGFSGNDSESLINGLGGEFAGDPWTLLDKSDAVGSAFNGVLFTLSAIQETATPDTYNWTLSWEDSPPGSNGLPLYTDFVFVTKGSNMGAAYYFDDVYFPSSDLSGDGTFLISYTNNGGQIPDLSHASVYGRLTDPFDPPVIDPPNGVPAPGTLLLMGLGLLGLCRSRRLR